MHHVTCGTMVMPLHLTLSRATVQYCATATCTNDHCIRVFSYTTSICVANNTTIVKRKSPFPCHIRGVAYTKSISCNAEAHARYRNFMQLASLARVTYTCIAANIMLAYNSLHNEVILLFHLQLYTQETTCIIHVTCGPCIT